MSDDLSYRRVFKTPPGVKLCTLDMIEDRKGRNFVLEIGDARFHGFVVRLGEDVRGYVDRCPHAGLPLAQKLDDYMTPDGTMIACSWHGALFDPETGDCLGGPCAGQKLTPWPVTIDGMFVKTA